MLTRHVLEAVLLVSDLPPVQTHKIRAVLGRFRGQTLPMLAQHFKVGRCVLAKGGGAQY